MTLERTVSLQSDVEPPGRWSCGKTKQQVAELLPCDARTYSPSCETLCLHKSRFPTMSYWPAPVDVLHGQTIICIW